MNDRLENLLAKAAVELLRRDIESFRINELKAKIEELQKELLELQYKRDFYWPKYLKEL